MQVGSGGSAGLSCRTQKLPLLHHLPRSHIEVFQMGIDALPSARVPEAKIISKARAATGLCHNAPLCCPHRCPLGASQVHPSMKLFPTGKGIFSPSIRVRYPPDVPP